MAASENNSQLWVKMGFKIVRVNLNILMDGKWVEK